MTDTLELIELDESMLDEIVCEVDSSAPATHWLKHDESGHFLCKRHANFARSSISEALNSSADIVTMVCEIAPCSYEDYSVEQVSVFPL